MLPPAERRPRGSLRAELPTATPCVIRPRAVVPISSVRPASSNTATSAAWAFGRPLAHQAQARPRCCGCPARRSIVFQSTPSQRPASAAEDLAALREAAGGGDAVGALPHLQVGLGAGGHV